MLLGIVNQFLGDHVQDREPVLDDGGQLPLEAGRDQFRHRVAVDLFGAGPGDPLEVLFRPGNAGGIGALRDRTDVVLDHVGDFVRVQNNHFKGFFGP